MKIFRSILAVILGIVVANLGIMLMHKLSEQIFTPPPALQEEFSKFQKGESMDREKVREMMQAMPIGAFLMVLLAWETGSLLGGAAAALIAGRGRCTHAGIVGGFVLAATIGVVMMVPGHPDWLILAGLLMPLPVSLAAGKIVSMLLPAKVTTASATAPSEAIQAGEPRGRP